MRAVALLGCWVAWGSVASAAPGVIVAAQVEAHRAPAEDADVVSALGHGATVCLVDEASEPGAAKPAPGWLAIHLPGAGGVAYVPAEAVDLTAAAASAEHPCGEPASAPGDAGSSAPAAATPAAPALRQGLVRPSIQLSSRAAVRPYVPDAPAPPPPPPVAPWTFLPLQPARLALGFGTGSAGIQGASATQHHFGNSGITFRASIGLTLFDVVSMSASAGAVFPSDNASFSEDVMPLSGGGDVSSASSHLEIHVLSAAIGLRTPYLALVPTETGAVAGGAFVDYGSSSIHGVRTISNCSDCRSDSLDMPSGTFWRAGVDVLIPSHKRWAAYTISLAYQAYQAGAGLTDEVRLDVTALLF